MGYGGSGYQIWDPIKRQAVVSNHVKVHENKLGSNWLKELANQSDISQPPPSRNHEDIDGDDDD